MSGAKVKRGRPQQTKEQKIDNARGVIESILTDHNIYVIRHTNDEYMKLSRYNKRNWCNGNNEIKAKFDKKTRKYHISEELKKAHSILNKYNRNKKIANIPFKIITHHMRCLTMCDLETRKSSIPISTAQQKTVARIRRLRSRPIVIVQEVETPIPNQLKTDAEVVITSTVIPSRHIPSVGRKKPTGYRWCNID